MANILPRLVSVFYGCTGVGCCLFFYHGFLRPHQL